jgi:hypothetical protein
MSQNFVSLLVENPYNTTKDLLNPQIKYHQINEETGTNNKPLSCRIKAEKIQNYLLYGKSKLLS